MAKEDLGEIVGLGSGEEITWSEGVWTFDEDDFLALALLQDPIYAAELCFQDPKNVEYSGCYRVRDYQYPLFRIEDHYAGAACGRSTGKTESIRARSFAHVFRRIGLNLLLTAPELIHLYPLTDAIEGRLRDTRLTREFLDCRGGKTGFTHRPFGVDFLDGTKIVGRIPRLTGPQPLEAKLLTPTGWTTMGAIQPDDLVIGSDGKPTRVLGITNTWEARVYELEFSDASVVEADKSHLWSVNAQGAPYRIMNTGEIEEALAGSSKRVGGINNLVRVPPLPCVEYSPRTDPLPVDPYVVGALLGDGSISQKCAGFSCADPDIMDEMEKRFPERCKFVQHGSRDTAFLIVSGAMGKERNPILQGLRELGLMGTTSRTKFIPDRIKYGTPQERLDCLRGLLDTDGTVKDGGSTVLVSASRTLVEDAAEIARSLGGWASVATESVHKPQTITDYKGVEYAHPGGVYWRATLRVQGQQLFLLPRKAAKYKVDGKQRHKAIRAVRPGRTTQVRCIKVAAEDGLYVTDAHTLTHNTGVKGQHQPDLIIDEAQDYPEKGWIEINETVMRETVDYKGDPDFHYHFYGVHSGARDSRFHHLIEEGEFRIINVTALQRPDWDAAQKANAKAMYGGTSSPDYRRNILGEAGAAASQMFVSSRLNSCLDQNRESDYNTKEYKHQLIRVEEFDDYLKDMAEEDWLDAYTSYLDLPSSFGTIYAGSDIGLTISPTEIVVFSHETVGKVERMKLLRRYTLERFREVQIRRVYYALAWHFGQRLEAFGIDATGLGKPIFQGIEDDPNTPQRLLDVARGYFFNAKVPVDVDPEFVMEDTQGHLRDQYGTAVKKEIDPLTNQERLVTYMPFIEASTRYLREWVDSGFLMLPFSKEIVVDMQGETEQRIKAVGKLSGSRKPNAFHILDAMRAASMGWKAGEVEEKLEFAKPMPVLDIALDVSDPMVGMGGMF